MRNFNIPKYQESINRSRSPERWWKSCACYGLHRNRPEVRILMLRNHYLVITEWIFK